MSSAVWTATCTPAAGAARWAGLTLAALGISGLRRARASQDSDRLSFLIEGTEVDATTGAFGYAVPVYSDTLEIFRDGTRWFYGRVTSLPRQATGDAESVSVEAEGPGWWLEHKVMEQPWQGQTSSYNKGRLILFRTLAGARRTVGDQIAEILQFALDAGAPIDWEAADLAALDASPPENEVLDVTCGEALRMCLRWAPDAMTWWDYSTSPYPTLRIARYATASAVSLPLADTPEQLGIRSRADLAIPGIRIRYERVTQADGETYTAVIADTAGDPDAFGALALTIDLQGPTMTTVTQKLVVAALAAVSSANFWKQFCPWMNDARISSLSIHDSAVDVPLLANQVLEGSVQDWMEEDLNVAVAESRATAQADYDIVVSGSVVRSMKNVAVSARVVSTSGASKTYRMTMSAQAGEAVPSGLAAKLYAALSIVHHEGSLVATAEDCRTDVWPGLVLNITGGLADWASMRAAIQQVEDDVEAGRTVLTFGPPAHLDAADYVSLLRPSRRRTATGKSAERTSGKAGDGQEVAISGPIPGLEGVAAPVDQKNSETIGTGTKKIVLDPSGHSAYQVLTVGSDGNTMQPGWVRAHG